MSNSKQVDLHQFFHNALCEKPVVYLSTLNPKFKCIAKSMSSSSLGESGGNGRRGGGGGEGGGGEGGAGMGVAATRRMGGILNEGRK